MSTPEHRHTIILERLAAHDAVTVSALSEELGVSAVTIRKDLKQLEDRGLLYRTHGGARRGNPYVTDLPVSEKAQIRAEEKERIGRAAAALIAPRDSVLFASGTTVHAVARQLAARAEARQLTAVTSAMDVAQDLARIPRAEVLLLGGIVRPSSSSVVGPYAVEFLSEHACDKLILGVDGFDLDFGLTTTSALEAELNQAMMRAAQWTIVVADASKFGRRGFRRICATEDVDLVVTDGDVDPEAVRRLEADGIEVQVV